MAKVIGLIGGIAPPSTIEYYQKLIDGFQAKGKTRQYPSILINSIDMTLMLEFVAKKEYGALVDYLCTEIQRLKDGGAEIVAIASNTPHIVFDRLREQSPVPMISIVEATVAAAKKRFVTKLGLFGTLSTMQSGFYQSVFSRNGIEIITPPLDSQHDIHEKYMNEFVKGIFLESTKKMLLAVAHRMKKESAMEGLILGGTELPFILKEEDVPDFTLLNTTEIHVQSILEYALNNHYGMN